MEAGKMLDWWMKVNMYLVVDRYWLVVHEEMGKATWKCKQKSQTPTNYYSE